MKRLIVVFTALLISSCSITPPLDDAQMALVRAGVPTGDGEVKFATVGIWLPGSRGFIFKAVEPRVLGTAVVTSKSFLFQQWGGPSGMTTAKRIPLGQIRSATLNRIGRSARLIVRTGDNSYDAFAASDGQGEISMGAGTVALEQALTQARAAFQTSQP